MDNLTSLDELEQIINAGFLEIMYNGRYISRLAFIMDIKTLPEVIVDLLIDNANNSGLHWRHKANAHPMNALHIFEVYVHTIFIHKPLGGQ